jgi:hypothetical protein
LPTPTLQTRKRVATAGDHQAWVVGLLAHRCRSVEPRSLFILGNWRVFLQSLSEDSDARGGAWSSVARTGAHAFSVGLLCPTLQSAHLPRSVLSKAIGHLAVLCATWRSRTWRRANSCLSRLKCTNKITNSPLQDLAFRLRSDREILRQSGM